MSASDAPGYRQCRVCKLSKRSGHFDTEEATICTMCRRIAVAPKPGPSQRVELHLQDDGTVWVQVLVPGPPDLPESIAEHTRLFDEVGYAGDTAPTDAEHNFQTACHWAQHLLDFGTAPTDD